MDTLPFSSGGPAALRAVLLFLASVGLALPSPPAGAQTSVETLAQTSLILTPQQFGARGDGISDDAPAFRAALAALSARGGGTLSIPSTGKPYLMRTWDPHPRDGVLFVAFIPSAVTLTGAGIIKIGDDIYPYPTYGTGGVSYGVSLFGSFGESNIAIRGLTFDMNGRNNLQPPGLPHIMNAFRFRGGSNVVLSGVTVLNCSGHNMVVFQDNTGRNAVIRNSRFSVGGRGIPGNTRNSDFSFLYSEWSYTLALGNTVFQDPSNAHASGGIELHGSHSRAQGNRIENCNPAIWIASTPGAVDDIVVSQNTIVRANRGIAFWVGSQPLTNVRITSNSIGVHYHSAFTYLYGLGDDAAGIIVPWLGAATTGKYVSSTANGSVIRNLTIKGNTIYGVDGVLSVNTMPGISVHGVRNALIAGNIIHDVGSSAIELRGSPWTNRNVIIVRNSLRDFGLSRSTAGHDGITVDMAGHSVVPPAAGFHSSNVAIFNNTLVGSPLVSSVGCSFNWVKGQMSDLTAGVNSAYNIVQMIVAAHPAQDGIVGRMPVETVSPRPPQGACAAGDITWRVARDTLDGWICAAGTWEILGH